MKKFSIVEGKKGNRIVDAVSNDQITVYGEDGNGTYESVSNTEGKTGVEMDDGLDGTALNGAVTVNEGVTVTAEVQNGSEATGVVGVDIYSDKGGLAELTIKGGVKVDVSDSRDQDDLFVVGIRSYGASETDIEIGKDILVKGGDNATGILSLSNEAGIELFGADTYISVAGDVRASCDGRLFATGIDVIGKGDITVGGTVSAKATSGLAYGLKTFATGGSVDIDGHLIAEGECAAGIFVDAAGCEGYDEYYVTIGVGGDVKASGEESAGIVISNSERSVDIVVEGDVVSSGTGIHVLHDSDCTGMRFAFLGTLSAHHGPAVHFEDPYCVGEEPSITVWKIESPDSVSLVQVDTDESECTELAERVQKSIMAHINYVLKADVTENGIPSSNGKLFVRASGGPLKIVMIGQRKYFTAHQGDKIFIKVETAEGYKSTLRNNGGGALTVNDDGTYTLIMPEGGGVDIEAVLEKTAF